jgi:CHAT domain-containing protein
LSAPPKIVHIAAHSLQRADAPLFTALQLAGEVLTVEQSYELPLTGTELVTLSGCTTASGQESESALLAFQSAFLLAGAQRVLTTLWPIADDAATSWMTFFYRALADGLPVPQAIQQTQQQCLADPALCHPALWAPFTSTRR